MLAFGIAETRYLLIHVNRDVNSINTDIHARKGYRHMNIFETPNVIDGWIANGRAANSLSNEEMRQLGPRLHFTNNSFRLHQGTKRFFNSYIKIEYIITKCLLV